MKEVPEKKGQSTRDTLIGLAIIFGIFVFAIRGCSGGSETTTQPSSSSVPLTTEQAIPVTEENPKVDPQETAYQLAMMQQGAEWTKAFQEFGELMGSTELFSDRWNLNVVVNLATMKGLIKGARDLSPPDRYKQINDTYMLAIDDFEWMVINLPEAIDNRDIELVNKCKDKIESGTVYVTQATALIKEIKPQ